MRGRFITLEGIDGAGKSTHLQWLKELLETRGMKVRATREPGGTLLGERLRELLLDREQQLAPETETLLMFAARREHLETVILPALDAGTWVLCDRFTDASYAYQSGGSGVAWTKVAQLEQWVHPGLQPDLTLLFDVTPELGRRRAQRGGTADRFEREEQAYFERVREAYLRRARAFPERMRIIDAGGSLDVVRKDLEEVVAALCTPRRNDVTPW
jgi:dTMP kinase